MHEEYETEYDQYVWEGTATKSFAGMLGGILSVLASLLVGIAVSWFAAIIINGYNYQNIANFAGNDSVGIRWIWGSAIWIGWISLSMGFSGGILAVIGTRDAGDDDDAGYKTYQPVDAKADHLWDDKMYI